MRLAFQLKKILNDFHDGGYGTIKRICEHSGLERHQVAKLLTNKVEYVSLRTLAGICQYLIHRHDVPLEKLPGMLFKFEATDFWAMLAKCRVSICLGVRGDRSRPEPRWVNAYDSYLHGVLLHELFELGHEQLNDLSQHLVRAYGPTRTPEEILKESQGVHEAFHDGGGNRALVCVGSVKSNPVSELLVADTFDTEPFTAQQNVSNPRQRRCPIYFHYRERDPQPPSCHGGMRLTRSRRNPQPGIHYETEEGRWEYCPNSPTSDAALVLYAYRPSEGTLEMILAGFSGRATGCIALRLQSLTNQLWPPNYSREDLKLGVFVIRFEFHESSPQQAQEQPLLVAPSETEVIPLASRVLERRLEGSELRGNHRTAAPRSSSARRQPCQLTGA